jgi:hypothetical protein
MKGKARGLLLMIAVFLYVDKPVASLQFDIITSGTIVLDNIVKNSKQIAVNTIDGKKRVIIYGLNQDTFVGKFAELNADAGDITNVVGADPDAVTVDVTVKPLSQPKAVTVRVVK